jgi:GNAT superfamily N-acetyltransferase
LNDLERIEREAFASSFAATPGAVAEEVGGSLCIHLPGAGLTRATGFDSIDLDATDSFFAGLGVERYVVAAPPELSIDEDLRAHGFEQGRAWARFARGVEPPPRVETELRVEQVDAGRADAIAAVVGEVMPPARQLASTLPGLPGWHCFVAYAGSEPAAFGALFAGERLGWLGVAATRPDFRRRGGQGSIMAARIERARELGLETLVTETGDRVDGRPEDSYRNIERVGFELRYVRPNWISPAH